MELLNANYVTALLMDHASHVKLRHDGKDLDNTISILLMLPPCLGILLPLFASSWMTYALCMHNLRICIVLLYGCPSTHMVGVNLRNQHQYQTIHTFWAMNLRMNRGLRKANDCFPIFEIAIKKVKLVTVLSHISSCTCSETI